MKIKKFLRVKQNKNCGIFFLFLSWASYKAFCLLLVVAKPWILQCVFKRYSTFFFGGRTKEEEKLFCDVNFRLKKIVWKKVRLSAIKPFFDINKFFYNNMCVYATTYKIHHNKLIDAYNIFFYIRIQMSFFIMHNTF